MKFTGNSRGAQLAILALLVVTLWFACTRRSEAAEQMFFAGAGQALAGSRPIAGGLRFGVEKGPWHASLVTHGETVLDDPNGAFYRVEPNVGACGTWNIARRRISIGWGACLWEHGDFAIGDRGPIVYDAETNTLGLDDDGVQLTAAISLRRTLGEQQRFYVEWFHASSGGSTWYNRGRNFFGGGARF